jgi:hypothetical protein
MSERLIKERLTRGGVRVMLVHAPEADPAQPWETICVDHGGVCSHETRRLAESWLSHPYEWCEDCHQRRHVRRRRRRSAVTAPG